MNWFNKTFWFVCVPLSLLFSSAAVSATFDRPRPNKNFRGPEGGLGALEIAARFSHLDLSDGLANGGKEYDITLGLNWYFNPNVKLMLNYVRAVIDHDLYDGDLNILQMRAQVDF